MHYIETHFDVTDDTEVGCKLEDKYWTMSDSNYHGEMHIIYGGKDSIEEFIESGVFCFRKLGVLRKSVRPNYKQQPVKFYEKGEPMPLTLIDIYQEDEYIILEFEKETII